jgi:hypothetical protein
MKLAEMSLPEKIRHQHGPFSERGRYCGLCSLEFPCPSFLAAERIEALERLVRWLRDQGVVAVAQDLPDDDEEFYCGAMPEGEYVAAPVEHRGLLMELLG